MTRGSDAGDRGVAAIDIGSDTIHLLVGRAVGSADGTIVERIEQRGELLELGRQVALTGSVGERAAHELERLVLEFVEHGRAKARDVIIAATEALRRAADGPELVDTIARRAGLPVRVLSGSREAQLGLLGARHRLDMTGVQLLIDSGGASTELTVTDGRTRVASASLPVGAALLGASLRGDPPEALSWALGGVQIGSALESAPPASPHRAWATGGSAHNLAGLGRTAGKSGAQVLTLDELGRLAAELLSKGSAKLARRSGEDPRRVAILPPGLLIVAAVLTHYGIDRVTVVPEGLRDGMIVAAATVGDAWWIDEEGVAAPAQ